MKVLCVCANGNSRSVALAYILKREYKIDALAVGLAMAAPETQTMLFEWADRILLTDKNFVSFIPPQYADKLKVYDVGDDRYFRGFNGELMAQFHTYLKDNPL